MIGRFLALIPLMNTKCGGMKNKWGWVKNNGGEVKSKTVWGKGGGSFLIFLEISCGYQFISQQHLKWISLKST